METGTTEGGTFRLMYVSHDRLDPNTRKRALGDLFSQARSNNKAKGITGALLLSGSTFVQTLEGDEETVRGVYERIRQDDRHDSVRLTEAGPVPARVFARWSMARVSDDGEADVPLIAHTDGIAPAAGRRTTPEQDAVLAAMHEVAADATLDPTGNPAGS